MPCTASVPVRSFAALAPLLCSCLAACGPHQDDRWSPVPPGVPIVDNPARTDAPLRLRLASAPLREYAVPDSGRTGADNGLLFAPLPGNGLVAAEATRLVVFDGTGRVERIIGREGDGPGEFRNITAICRSQDNQVVVEDFNRALIHIGDVTTGDLLESLSNSVGHLPQQACFADGSFAVGRIDYDRTTRDRTFVFVRLSPSGEPLDSLASLTFSRDRLLQSGYPKHAAQGRTWMLGDAYYSEVRDFDERGALRRVIRTRDRLIERSAAEHFRSLGIEMAAGSKGSAGGDVVSFRDPFYGPILLGPEGQLWIRDQFELDHAEDVWTSFDSTGVLSSRLVVRPLQGEDEFYVLGFVDDGAVVHHVSRTGAVSLEVYPLVSTEP